MRWALTEWEKWEILSAMSGEIGFLGESSIKKRDNFGRGFLVMEQIENVLPFPFSGGKGGDAGRLSKQDGTFSALLSTDMSGFHIAPAVFAFNFVKVRGQRPHSARLDWLDHRRQEPDSFLTLKIIKTISKWVSKWLDSSGLCLGPPLYLGEGHPWALDGHHAHRLAELQVQNEDLPRIQQQHVVPLRRQVRQLEAVVQRHRLGTAGSNRDEALLVSWLKQIYFLFFCWQLKFSSWILPLVLNSAHSGAGFKLSRG